MKMNELSLTPEGVRLREELTLLRKEYADLYAQKEIMVNDERETLYVFYLNTVGQLNYELFCLSVELSALKLKVQLAQAAVNRSERVDVTKIEKEINKQMNEYYAQIKQQAQQLELAQKAVLMDDVRAKEIKELYRLLVKRLHPDLHPYQSDKMNDLFLQVQTAYHTQNLEMLQNIVLRIDLDKIDDDDNQFTTDTVTVYVASLQTQIEKIKKEIAQLEESFPFIYRECLKDEAWIENEKAQLKERIEQFKNEKEIYEDRFNLLTEL